LIRVTGLKTIEAWYNPNRGDGGAPLVFSDYFDAKDPPAEDVFVEQLYARGLRLTCRLLDLYDFFAESRNNEEEKQNDENDKDSTARIMLQQQQQDLPIWYWNGIALLTTMARSMAMGMDVVRTRVVDLATLSDGQGGSWMPNALDVAVKHMFSFSWLEDGNDDDGAPIVAPMLRRQRQAAIEGWVRLWHQALFFVQQQQDRGQQPNQNQHGGLSSSQQERKQSSSSSSKGDISFRSLLLDHQDYYTGACARLLTDSSIRPEIQSMIRAQMEELALDEDEHDEMQLSIKQVRQ
jgi:hypothetical protein